MYNGFSGSSEQVGISADDLWNNTQVDMSVDAGLRTISFTFKNTKAPNYVSPCIIKFFFDKGNVCANYGVSGGKFAFNDAIEIDLTDEEFRNTSYMRVLYKLFTNNNEISDDYLKLLIVTFSSNMCHAIYESRLQEDVKTMDEESNHIRSYIASLFYATQYQFIHNNIKTGDVPAEEEFVDAMNNFFTKKQEEENKQQNNQNVSNFYNNEVVNVSNDAEKNGCCDECISLKNCWSYIKSCFDCG